MTRVFEFLYYSLYRMFALIKRVGEKDENLASFFYSILLSTNTINILFLLKFVIPKGSFTPYPYNVLLKVLLASFFFIWYFACKNYFLKQENYVRIIAFYKNKHEDNRMALIGILYSLFTFGLFISSAFWLSKI